MGAELGVKYTKKNPGEETDSAAAAMTPAIDQHQVGIFHHLQLTKGNLVS